MSHCNEAFKMCTACNARQCNAALCGVKPSLGHYSKSFTVVSF